MPFSLTKKISDQENDQNLDTRARNGFEYNITDRWRAMLPKITSTVHLIDPYWFDMGHYLRLGLIWLPFTIAIKFLAQLNRPMNFDAF